MPPIESTTVIFPLDLGDASRFEESIFPVAYYDGVSTIIKKGSLLLSATLDEIIKMKEMGIDLTSNPQFLLNTKTKYEDLAAKQARLEQLQKSRNPIKFILNYRAARMFYAGALGLRNQTKETSEQMQRREKEIRAVPSTEIRVVHGEARSNANISGFAIQVPGALNAENQQAILDAANMIATHACNPFVDNLHIPQLSDDDSIITLADTASLLSQDVSHSNPREGVAPTSPGSSTYHIYHVYNSAMITGSHVHALTLNNEQRDDQL